MIIRKLARKTLNLLNVTLRNDMDIDLKSEISMKTFNNFKGKKNNKVLIRNSILSNCVSLNVGCKLIDVKCSGSVKLGRYVSLTGPSTRLSARIHGVEVGSFTSIASNVVIQEDYHRVDKVSTYFMNQNIFNSDASEDKYSKGKIKIEEDVWIGSNSTVLSGVTIGRGSIVGAGSVVTKDIPRYSIAVGNPSIVIKSRFPEHIIEKLERSRWWEFDINTLKQFKSDFNKNLLENSDIFEDVLQNDRT